jgi:cardiolipin synthase
LILAKAREASDAAALSEVGRAAGTPMVAAVEPIETFVSRDALYEDGDLIIDGEDHRVLLERMIQNVSERLIIHSTFITEARAQALLPALLNAAAKGVTIDILWGQDDAGGGTNASSAAAQKLQADVAAAGRGGSITIHPFSTNSHAKIIVADNGRGGWTAVVGSCNWLASDFTSFEASIRLRDPAMVGDLVRRLGGLSRGRPGVWHDLAIEMTVLGRRITEMPRGRGRTVSMRMLCGVDHARVVLEARDRARTRIFVLSHRVGIAARPMALLPSLAAVRSNGVDASFYYGRTTGPLSGVAGADLTREFAKEGLAIRPVHRPRVHAKVLGWDDNALAVTSLNWLSADPADAAPYREIGVLIEAPRVADNFIRRFELARAD